MKQLLVIEPIQPSDMNRSIVRLGDWMGVETIVIRNRSHSSLMEELKQFTRNGQVCVAAHADTLTHMSELSEALHAISEFSVERSVPILVYGISSAPSHTVLLKNLGCRCIDGVHHVQKQPLRFKFSPNEKVYLQQLAGLEFSSDGASDGCNVFELTHSTKEEVVPLLYAEGYPLFIRTQAEREKIELYLWATNRIADVGALALPGTRPEDMYQWLLPAIVYLKACFGSRCWHNPNVRARLIIDDPLLHDQYGFLRYDALVNSMHRVPYGTSLAFIPWNYSRSQKQVADLFQAHKDLLSLCIHGCDHINHEFDSDDHIHLSRIAALALQRMKMHHARSGVLHEEIMVFPQGLFSSTALRALRDNGFLAAVNSSCYPSREETHLTIGDLLLPAVCHFHGFPIFLRRSPDRIVDIAVDLFVGKAGLVCEHHDFVRDGFGSWEQFAAQMNALDERLSWSALIETITETCLQKVVGDDEIDIRFFTRVFQWTNHLERPLLARLSKLEPDPALIKEVRVNGQNRSFRVAEGYVHFDAIVGGKDSIRVEILDKVMKSELPFRPSLGYQIRVGSRRLLSEFRDNTLARHPPLLEYAKSLARHLRLTGDSR